MEFQYGIQRGVRSWLADVDGQDFGLGAKEAPCLNSATTGHGQFEDLDLPEWLESQDIETIGIFDHNVQASYAHENNYVFNGLIEDEIKFTPEDFLNITSKKDDQVTNAVKQEEKPTVSNLNLFSEPNCYHLQIQNNQGIDFQIATEKSSVPKITICVKKVFIQNNKIQEPVSPVMVVPDGENIPNENQIFNELMTFLEEEESDPLGENMDSVSLEDIFPVDEDLIQSALITSNLNDTDFNEFIESDVSSWGSEPVSPVSSASSVSSMSPAYSYSTLDSTLLPPTNKNVRVKERSHKLKRCGAAVPESQHQRKKEQNKKAALRYRQKKRGQDDGILSVLKAEEDRRAELQTKYAGLKQELGFLKKIMREVFLANGVLSHDDLKKHKKKK